MFSPHNLPKVPECDCAKCKNMCQNPCAPTAAQAWKMHKHFNKPIFCYEWFEISMDTGYMGFYYLKLKSIYRPTYPGLFKNSCIFLNSDLHCELHGTGHKPVEGVAAHHNLSYDTARQIYISIISTYATWLGCKIYNKISDDYKHLYGEELYFNDYDDRKRILEFL
jgi:hypothetical protein